ncbi:hypothetical protein [Butyricimonas sp.]|uniref:hypothetical protein n=1 Tax=Butyricimonas sp. TaxID=1969738 RepID=UPI0025BEC2A5|nr:hypothetical protein [Butyricimonas sp.]
MKRVLKTGCLGVLIAFVIIAYLLANANTSLLVGILLFFLFVRLIFRVVKYILYTFIMIVIALVVTCLI